MSLLWSGLLYTLMEIRETAGRVLIDTNKRSSHQEKPPRSCVCPPLLLLVLKQLSLREVPGTYARKLATTIALLITSPTSHPLNREPSLHSAAARYNLLRALRHRSPSFSTSARGALMGWNTGFKFKSVQQTVRFCFSYMFCIRWCNG